ncbi:MAG: hypothetical protein R3F59_06305 [Myxococcota bacterium]
MRALPLLMLLVSGCELLDDLDPKDTAAADTAATTDTLTTPTAAFPAGFRALVDGVVFVPPTCDPGAAEACNARDDDCDGQIDEGCGVPTGDGVQVVLAQVDAADFALSVESPVAGHRLNVTADADVDYGGTFVRVRSERCTFAAPEDDVQGALWEAPAPGSYRVDLSAPSGCDAFEGDIDAVVEVGVAIDGAFVGSFRIPHHQDAFGSTVVAQALAFDVP